MEEEKLVKKELVNDNEEKIVPTNENNQKNNSNKKGLIIGIIVAIILIIAGGVTYFCFIKKDDSSINNKENNEQNEIDNNSKNNEKESINSEYNNEQEDDKNKIDKSWYGKIDKSWYGEYKTADKKYTIKIHESGISINNKELINVYGDDLDEQKDKYLSFSAGFYPPLQLGVTDLDFVLNKEKKLIEEKPGDKDITDDECGSQYGEYARFYGRCYGFGYININENYFFVDYSEFDAGLFTTDWKKLGRVHSIDELKYDNKGIYVCEDVDIDEKNDKIEFKCINEMKFDYNGNKIS